MALTGNFAATVEATPLSLATLDSSPKGTPYGTAGNLAATAEAFTHRGKVARSAG